MSVMDINEAWLGPVTRFDMVGVYRAAGDGVTLFELPMRRHTDWTRKGFTLIAVARVSDLQDQGAPVEAVAHWFDPQGHFDHAAYVQAEAA